MKVRLIKCNIYFILFKQITYYTMQIPNYYVFFNNDNLFKYERLALVLPL